MAAKADLGADAAVASPGELGGAMVAFALPPMVTRLTAGLRDLYAYIRGDQPAASAFGGYGPRWSGLAESPRPVKGEGR